jgi:putative transposase
MSGQIAKLKDGFIKFPKKTGLKPLKTNVDNVKQVRIIPQATCHVVEVVYEKKIKDEKTDENLYLSIDLGINNLATCVTNVGGLPPFIVNGKIVKSINQYYNKTKAKLMSTLSLTKDTKDKKTSNRINRLTHKRNCKIDDYMHKSSRFIIDYCVEHEIGNIVVGYNVGWKDEVNIGKVNNQKFVSIPFDKFVKQLEYKAEEVGITVQRQEESYTSKCDAFALETICKHDKYLGKRVKRGLFKSSVDRFVNSDVNGTMNILRKVIGDGFVKNIADRGILDMPLVVSVS